MASLKTLEFLCLLMINVSMFIETATAKCISDDYVNGCSIPFRSYFPYAKVFKKACDKHDICYGCAQEYEWTRKQCDDTFLKDMLKTCLGTDDIGQCKRKADSYHTVVRWLGFFSFRYYTTPKWCSMQKCVNTTGAPI
eukprot:Seg1509.6 transcript_id=Seg1509.6/GoldUCD/mRNA.D3Y31 product="Conodipine-M alpha chain" protein_id=Seg1509.6/GoldUCD/D3Y31